MIRTSELAREQKMAKHQVSPQGAKLAALDPIWDRVRTEAEDIVRREPELASFIYSRSEEHTSELQSRQYLVCRLLLEKKNKHQQTLTNRSTIGKSHDL